MTTIRTTRPRTLFAALGLGAAAGLALHPWAQSPWLQGILTHGVAPVGQIFLRLLLMSVLPLLITGLILGVTELGAARGGRLGKIASRTLFYTFLTSGASVLIGVFLVNLMRPGDAARNSEALRGIASSSQVSQLQDKAAQAKPFSQALVELVPRNPLEAAVKALDGDIIALMVFALIFGLALSRSTSQGSGGPLVPVLEQVFHASMKVVDFAMRLAPIGVFALILGTVMKFGPSIFLALGLYVLTVVAGLLLQQFLTYGILLKAGSAWQPVAFFKKCREVYLYAFATASSNATLPRSMALAENELGIPKDISRFVLTIGSSANQNGTALFEGVTVLFLAQFYGIDLSIGAQFTVVFMSILAGIGTAGVPGGSLPLVMVLMQQVGVPAEGIGIILGVDRFLDMCRTTINVSGDLVVAAMVGGPKQKAA